MLKKKILFVVPSLSRANGISTFCINYLEKLNLDKYSIDFLVMGEQPHDYYEVVESKGCNIFEIKFNQYHGLKKVKAIQKIRDFFKENEYDIIHCNTSNFGAFTQYYAKKYGIKTRILHSHEIISSAKLLNRLRNSLMKPLAVVNSNYYLACSEEAGQALFKRRKFDIINNCINAKNYYFDENIRKEMREKYHISDFEFVIGTVGRLSKIKNQRFLIDILEELHHNNLRAKLILVGDGPERNELKQYAVRKQLDKYVIFTGTQNDVNAFYNLMDVFMLPSFAEGLGLVLIEAELTGVKCLASENRIPKKTKYTELLKFIPIESGVAVWAEEVLKSREAYYRESRTKEFENSEFNIENEVKKLEKIYDEKYNG